MTAAEAALREWLRAAGGGVSVEEWMRWALYDPVHGYYARRVRTVGRQGDFSTAATLHPALGTAVARWAARHRDEGRGSAGRWHLVELGGGSGELAAVVLSRLGWWARRGLRYHLVEVSGGLRETQRARLDRWSERVVWHDTLAAALDAAGGSALLFSNEFADAFPCARWRLVDGRWHEGRVVWPDGAPVAVETWGAPVSAADLGATCLTAASWPDGQRVEVGLAYRRWQAEQFAGWRRGRCLTVDYGGECPALYARRPRGTLRAYCRQMLFVGAEVFARPGQQDLTADVNFSDLRRWGEALGLVTGSEGTQAAFLRRWLPAAVLRTAGADGRLAALLDDDGAGGAFRVLEQVRAPGFSARDRQFAA